MISGRIDDESWPAAIFCSLCGAEQIGQYHNCACLGILDYRVTPRGEDPLDATGTACPGASRDDAKRREGPSLRGKINRPGAQVTHVLSNVDEVSASRCHVGATS